MSNKTLISKNTLEMALTAILSALILLMTFCGIGYIPLVYPLKLTLLTLPVAVGSVLLGWKIGLVLGGVFGISSFITCFGMDPFGATLLGINPVLCAIMCIVPRLLCGVLPAFIYEGISLKDKKGFVAIPVATTATALLNTLFFLTFLWVFFVNKTDLIGKNFFSFFIASAGINALLEAAVCLVAGSAITKALQSFMKRL